MRILIVEDEEKLARLVADRLKRDHYTVDISNDGEDGLYNALSGMYDLIILDIMLPKKDGIEILKELRKESEEVKRQAEEQIQEHKEAAEKAKADAAFEKYVPSSLRAEINEALGETRSAPVPPEDPDKPKKPTLDDIFGEMKK